MGELEGLRRAGFHTTLALTRCTNLFDFDCRDHYPLGKCIRDIVTKKEIEKLEQLTGKTVVLQCPFYLVDVEE